MIEKHSASCLTFSIWVKNFKQRWLSSLSSPKITTPMWSQSHIIKTHSYLFQAECLELLEVISDRINSRNTDFVSHLLLSVFKMAEVEIIQIEPASSSRAYHVNVKLIVLSVAVSLILTKFTSTMTS